MRRYLLASISEKFLCSCFHDFSCALPASASGSVKGDTAQAPEHLPHRKTRENIEVVISFSDVII
jgi:hypothetical protein